MSYVIPVDKYRLGWTHGQRSLTWPGGHPGVDLLPRTPRTRQVVKQAAKGAVTRLVGGTCHGFDWKDEYGRVHRYCHVEYPRVGQRFAKGEVITRMTPKGMLIPPGATHLHWVVWDRGRMIDPMGLFTSLDYLRASINKHFRNQFKREPEKEDNDYVLSRVGQPLPLGINTEEDLIEKLRFWSRQPHEKWLAERKKVLNK